MVGEEILRKRSRVPLGQRREKRESLEGRKAAGRSGGQLLTTWSVAVRAVNQRQTTSLIGFLVPTTTRLTT
jgi:hypothetical protein